MIFVYFVLCTLHAIVHKFPNISVNVIVTGQSVTITESDLPQDYFTNPPFPYVVLQQSINKTLSRASLSCMI